jgi:hypothetical protein
MSDFTPPRSADRLPIWELARRWGEGDEAAARLAYARLWAAYWRDEFLADAFQFWVRAAPDEGTFLTMPPTGPGGLFGLTDGSESLGRFVASAPAPGAAAIDELVRWGKDDYDRIRSRLLRIYIDGAHVTRSGFLRWCQISGIAGTQIWPEAATAVDRGQACRVWIATRKALRGDESRKILWQAATVELPGLTEIEFREAFREIYGRKPVEPSPADLATDPSSED